MAPSRRRERTERSKSLRITLGLALVAVLAAACQPAAAPLEEPEEPAPPAAHEVHWGYEGQEGPEHWAELSPEYTPCRDGREQSPVDLTDAVPASGARLERRIGTAVLNLDQRARVMDLVDNGHTIQITNDAPLSLDVDGEHFELVQYHFHAPSEHTIDGEHAPLEAHFVHKSAAGKLAVAAVLFEEGAHNPIVDPIVSSLPSGPGAPRHLEGLELGMSQLPPLPEHYYRYEGSLTTPPCTEGVKWIVSAERRPLSAEQMAAFTTRLHDNNRPVQPRGDREIALVFE
jgi:carbonic anhydrase